MNMKTRTVRINEDTALRLELLGHKGETFDDLISRLLDMAEKEGKTA